MRVEYGCVAARERERSLNSALARYGVPGVGEGCTHVFAEGEGKGLERVWKC
jgi:hypothetical protein